MFIREVIVSSLNWIRDKPKSGKVRADREAIGAVRFAFWRQDYVTTTHNPLFIDKKEGLKI